MERNCASVSMETTVGPGACMQCSDVSRAPTHPTVCTTRPADPSKPFRALCFQKLLRMGICMLIFVSWDTFISDQQSLHKHSDVRASCLLPAVSFTLYLKCGPTCGIQSTRNRVVFQTVLPATYQLALTQELAAAILPAVGAQLVESQTTQLESLHLAVDRIKPPSLWPDWRQQVDEPKQPLQLNGDIDGISAAVARGKKLATDAKAKNKISTDQVAPARITAEMSELELKIAKIKAKRQQKLLSKDMQKQSSAAQGHMGCNRDQLNPSPSLPKDHSQQQAVMSYASAARARREDAVVEHLSNAYQPLTRGMHVPRKMQPGNVPAPGLLSKALSLQKPSTGGQQQTATEFTDSLSRSTLLTPTELSLRPQRPSFHGGIFTSAPSVGTNSRHTINTQAPPIDQHHLGSHHRLKQKAPCHKHTLPSLIKRWVLSRLTAHLRRDIKGASVRLSEK